MSDTEKNSDPQREIKIEIREWLKLYNLNAKWLACWLDKSEGTVKNWLYNTYTITEENLRKIESLKDSYLNGEIGNSLKSNGKPITSVSMEAVSLIGWVENERSVPLWRAAAGVSEYAFMNECLLQGGHSGAYDHTSLDAIKLARWATVNIMNAAKETLRELRSKMEESSELFRLASLQPAKSEFKDVDHAQDGYFIDSYLFPVIMENFNIFFVRIATKVEGYDEINDWMNYVLDAAAESSLQADLENILD